MEAEIKEIRYVNGKQEFKIHWKGTPDSGDTWEPYSVAKFYQNELNTFLISRENEIFVGKDEPKQKNKPEDIEWTINSQTAFSKHGDITAAAPLQGESMFMPDSSNFHVRKIVDIITKDKIEYVIVEMPDHPEPRLIEMNYFRFLCPKELTQFLLASINV